MTYITKAVEEVPPGLKEVPAGPTLLLVESPGNESERYRKLAKRAGFRILTANSKSMARVASLRSRPDLVLILPFPGPPGASELARCIKEDPGTAEIPVMVLMDGDSQEEYAMAYPTEACASVSSSDDHLVQTMRAVRKSGKRDFERQDSEVKSPCTLEGDFAEDTFPGVLEFLFTARKTGRVVVLDGSRRPGYIYIEDGDVVHCELAPHKSVDAFDRMCFLAKGTFKFEPEFRAATRTMRRNGREVLLDSARRRDERARSREEQTERADVRSRHRARRFRGQFRLRRAV